MEKEFVHYELAVKLKELGFDELCICGYGRFHKLYLNNSNTYNNHKGFEITSNNGRFPAPLWQQAFSWFLKEYDFWQYIFPNIHNKDWCFHIQWYKESFGWGESHIQNGFKTYEEARLECLNKLIELVEEENGKT